MAFNLQNINKQKEYDLKPVISLQSDRTGHLQQHLKGSLRKSEDHFALLMTLRVLELAHRLLIRQEIRSKAVFLYFCKGPCSSVTNLLTTTGDRCIIINGAKLYQEHFWVFHLYFSVKTDSKSTRSFKVKHRCGRLVQHHFGWRRYFTLCITSNAVIAVLLQPWTLLMGCVICGLLYCTILFDGNLFLHWPCKLDFPQDNNWYCILYLMRMQADSKRGNWSDLCAPAIIDFYFAESFLRIAGPFCFV